MTVSYGRLNICGLLFRWHASIWRALWKEVLIFHMLYFSLSVWYRSFMSPSEKLKMETIVQEFKLYLEYIPLTFLLGFYVSSMLVRWWKQFENIAWPDKAFSYINLVLPGNDDASVRKRLQMGRYLVLACTLTWRNVSTRVKKRFPSAEYLVSTGLMTKEELKIYQHTKNCTVKWQLPLEWCQRMMETEQHSGKIAPPVSAHFVNNLNNYKESCWRILAYDWALIPLMYSQVVGLATYSYFLVCVIARQYLDPSKNIPGFKLDMYVPIFTTLQLVCFIGWYKVGLLIMRPFGENENDFEFNYLIDRHHKLALEMLGPRLLPSLTGDHLQSTSVIDIPYTRAASLIREHHPKSKTRGMEELFQQDELVLVNVYGKDDTGVSEKRKSIFNPTPSMAVRRVERSLKRKRMRKLSGFTDNVSETSLGI